MKWGKFVLFFQAIVTMVIGLVLLSQFLFLDSEGVGDDNSKDLKMKLFPPDVGLENLKYRFGNASYILVTIALIEMIIVWRLVS